MIKQYTGTFLKVTIITLIAFGLNMGVYAIPGIKAPAVGFTYPLWVVYAFFFVFSLIILGVLIKVSEKNTGQAGYLFLLLTSAKMAASYLLARPIISKTIEFPTEKINFFAVFLLFLAIEAYFTVRLLNNKQ
jgi:hypothetical protein